MMMDSTQKGRAVVFVNAKDASGNPVLCAIKIDGKARYNRVEIDSNVVLSVYGKDVNPIGYIERAVEEGRMVYWNKKMSQELFESPGLQLPNNLKQLDSDTIIHKFGENVNPESEKSSQENSDLRFSRSSNPTAEDNRYLEAVRKGDTKTAQKMVDQAAEKAGYEIKAYHGTKSFGFTTFHTSNVSGLWFADSRDVARSYSENDKDVYSACLKANNTIEINCNGSNFDQIAIDPFHIPSGLQIFQAACRDLKTNTSKAEILFMIIQQPMI